VQFDGEVVIPGAKRYLGSENAATASSMYWVSNRRISGGSADEGPLYQLYFSNTSPIFTTPICDGSTRRHVGEFLVQMVNIAATDLALPLSACSSHRRTSIWRRPFPGRPTHNKFRYSAAARPSSAGWNAQGWADDMVLTFTEDVKAADAPRWNEVSLSGGTLGTVTIAGSQMTVNLSGAPRQCLQSRCPDTDLAAARCRRQQRIYPRLLVTPTAPVRLSGRCESDSQPQWTVR